MFLNIFINKLIILELNLCSWQFIEIDQLNPSHCSCQKQRISLTGKYEREFYFRVQVQIIFLKSEGNPFHSILRFSAFISMFRLSEF